MCVYVCVIFSVCNSAVNPVCSTSVYYAVQFALMTFNIAVIILLLLPPLPFSTEMHNTYTHTITNPIICCAYPSGSGSTFAGMHTLTEQFKPKLNPSMCVCMCECACACPVIHFNLVNISEYIKFFVRLYLCLFVACIA